MASLEQTKAAIAAVEPTITLQAMIEKSAKELGRALPEHMRAERLVRIALTCIRTTPGLDAVTPASFLGALFTSAQLGIEPIAGRAYIIPFKNSRKKADGTWHKVSEAEFVLGYKGVVELFYRHDKAVQIDWGVVHEKDDFGYELGTHAYLKHVPTENDRGAVKGYWVMATLAGGGKPFKYMTAVECLEHAKAHSKTFDSRSKDFYPDSPWKTEPEAMSLKTVLVQLAKVLPLSFELQRALAQDETSRDFRAGIDSALDMPTTTDWSKDTKSTDESNTPVSTAKAEDIEFGPPPPNVK